MLYFFQRKEADSVRLEGKVFAGGIVRAMAVAEDRDESRRFVSRLEECLRSLCRELAIPIPIWMKKNTGEFARFHQTVFVDEQFHEPVAFDRFQIRLLPEDRGTEREIPQSY